ncbi:MAG: DNA-processing protein DprA [Alphaproteobacteria bacterium]|nr:DNA-processing protein DprA [Alphaproteobacteria bacterium]
MNNDLLQKLLIIRSPGIGPAKYKNLLQEFGDVYSVVDSLHLTQSFIDSVYKEIETANNLGIQYIADDNDLYPKNLLKIKNHPIILSVRGNTDTLTKRCVAMVGTRHASAVGMRFISNLAEQFVKNNFVVVSGMAIGTDSAAHMGALNTVGNTQTIAVLAGGVDNIWPIENESLYYNILDRGVIVSEMPVGHKPLTQNFVQRNRWIAGLAEQLILGEADINSGSMTTAQFAINYNIPVFAVPGHPSDSRNMGPNMLIKQGKAKL